MANTPVSYKDPYWSDLAASTEAKLGLPQGLLVSVLTNGERSNADQVSEAGARTPFQIIPATRKAAIDKYGVDPYLNPENAAEVAGRLLKDSLDRNKGDQALAVAEYHGGTDRANWGPRTRSYVTRVLGGQAVAADPAAAGGSTFQRALAAQQPAANSNAISAVYQAYKAGKMSPEEAGQFEADVKSGLVMLPRGAALNGQETKSPMAKPEPMMLPKEVTDAYVNGKMSEQERNDLEADMRAGIVKLPPGSSMAQFIPTDDPNWKPPTEQGIINRPKEPTLGERLVGAGEAGLTTVTGLTGGTAGMITGTAKGITQSILDGTFGTQQAADLVEQQAMKNAQDWTYMPRTEQGREQAQAVGDAMQQLVPLGPLGGEMAALGAGVKAATPAVRAGAARAAAPVANAAGKAAETVKSAAGKVNEMVRGEPAAPTQGTMGSAGAAGTDVATMRRANAEELGFTGDSGLTKGQATRDFEQLRFEQEAAKNPELGTDIRTRGANQHAKARQLFESWIDETGAQAPDARGVGVAVDKALTARAARDKAEIRVAYKEAEKAGELKAPVQMGELVDTLNNSRSAESTAPVLTAARKELVRLGGAVEDANGNLVAQDMTLANAEQLRKFVNKVTGNDPTNIKFAVDLKKAIDASTEGAGGELYAKARGLRAKYADQYENRAVIADLLNTKRGMADRKVALEDVFDRVVFRGSLDDMRTARKMLQTGGEEGKQAWSEIQGQAVRYIRDEATKGVARDINGQEMISPGGLDKAIKRLDTDGKLDYLFGKQGAEKLRGLNDLSKVLFTTPPGSVNTSNTASVLLAALDMAISGSAGMPMPVMSGLRMLVKNVKDRKIRARINDALGGSGSKAF